MCGIAGIISTTLSQEHREELVQRMVRTLRHRGPDERAVRSAEIGTVGVARLAIVDRSAGRQPMVHDAEGEHTLLAYNGEIYNFCDLRTNLQARGFCFQTHSDTEVVLAAHLRHGPRAAEHFDGMFAYAAWQPNAGKAVLVRDRLGIKPLFFVDLGHSLFFASEPKALLCCPQVVSEPNPLAILEYFLHGAGFASGYVTGEHSFFRGVRSIPPGHILTWTAESGAWLQRYWSPVDDLGTLATDEAAVGEELEDAITDSVRSALMGEVPIGTALSGGLDSSLLTALAVRSMNEPLLSASITYRSDFDDPDAHHATLVSKWLNQRSPGAHQLLYTFLQEDTYLDRIDDMVRAFDEPHWEIRQLAMFENYRTLADAGRTVVLTGEGADELFFGYYQKFPGFRSPAVSSPSEFATAWRDRIPWVMQLLRPAFDNGLLPSDACDGLVDAAVATYLTPAWQVSGDRLRAVQCWYMQTFLPWLLMVNDRCSMAVGLEGRFPFLSRRVVSMALAMPPEWNSGADGVGREKRMLRRMAKGRLPIEVWRDREKAPLPVPESATYHQRIADRLSLEIADSPVDVWGWLDRHTIEGLLRDFRGRVQSVSLDGGNILNMYTPLGQPLVVRTVHLFAILTFLRWFRLCVNPKGTNT